MTPEERLEHKRAYVRNWQASHRERTRELAARWRATHPGYNDEHARKQRAEKPEQVLAAIKRWRAANLDKVKAYRQKAERLAKQRNPDKFREKWRARKARKRGAEGHFAARDIIALFEKQLGICAGCNCALEVSGPNKYHVDHIVPLKPRAGSILGTNNPENLQLLCPKCNCSKGNMAMDEWLKKRAR
jgi:5-methylcytosine-specific restriction endonuclease McrA